MVVCSTRSLRVVSHVMRLASSVISSQADLTPLVLATGHVQHATSTDMTACPWSAEWVLQRVHAFKRPR